MGQVSSPGLAVCWPSAIVRPTWMRTRSPAAIDWATSSPASGSTPITRVRGETAAHTVAHPEMRPPPPTGTMSTSSASTSSSSSSATVPWPAITRALSNGCTSTMPRSAASSWTSSSRSSP